MKRILLSLALVATAIGLMAQQLPTYEATKQNQVRADRATQAHFFLAIPSGPVPFFPSYVADSLKCKAIFNVNSTSGGKTIGLYRYNCATGTWALTGYTQTQVQAKLDSMVAIILLGNNLYQGTNTYLNPLAVGRISTPGGFATLEKQRLLIQYPDGTLGVYLAPDYLELHTIDGNDFTVANGPGTTDVSATLPLRFTTTTRYPLAPSDPSDLANKDYVDNRSPDGTTLANTYLKKSGDTLTGPLILPNVNPTNADQAIPKFYLDNIITGITWKNSVRVCTTGNITLSGTQTIDGTAVVAGNRVLVNNQTSTKDNGIYLVAAGAWTRVTDADAGDELSTATVAVMLGTTYKNTQWTYINGDVPVVGTDPIKFGQISGAGTYTNGSGIDLAGNAFSSNIAYARSLISATGSITYNPATGLFSYTQPTTVSTFTNDAGYHTNATGDARYPQLSGSYANPNWITGIAWSKLTGTAPVLSTFSNDAGYLTAAGHVNCTIFTPVTGATITAINQQTNIIFPAGTIATLTINLPASPADGDQVTFKFGNAVTTITYGVGTVAFPTTTAGVRATFTYTYKSATSTWY